MVMKPMKKERRTIKKRKILPEVFGMWKDRWPKSMSSTEIANKLREEAWRGKYDR